MKNNYCLSKSLPDKKGFTVKHQGFKGVINLSTPGLICGKCPVHDFLELFGGGRTRDKSHC